MMKKNNIVSIIFFIIVTCTCIRYAEYVLRPTGAEDECIDQIKAFHSLERESLDVIAYGSSHAWLGFDSNEFSNNLDINVYNYACFWQSFNTTWLFFHDSLKNQSPKLALIETGRISDYLTDQGVTGQILYSHKISCSKEKLNYLSQCFVNHKKDYLKYYFPLSIFHNNWKNINGMSFFRKCQKERFIESKGQNISSGITPISPQYIGADMIPGTLIYDEIMHINDVEGGEVGQVDIPDNCLKLLDDICATCKKNGIILVLYTVPYAGDFNYSDALKEYADNNDCYYVNLFEHLEEMNFDSMTDFCDADHLNANGAKKVSIFLADYIKEQIGVLPQ